MAASTLQPCESLLSVLERITPALSTAAHLMRLHGNHEEAEMFEQDAATAREAIGKARGKSHGKPGSTPEPGRPEGDQAAGS